VPISKGSVRRSQSGSRLLYGCLLLGLLVRIGAIVILGDRALDYSSDTKAYQDIAVNLVERGRFITAIDPPHTLDKLYATRPPLTPWLLAGVYEVFGPTLRYGQLLLALVGVAACFVLYRLGSAVFDERVGLWACFLGAINPLWALFAAMPMTESIAILLYPLLALCCIRLFRVPSLPNAVLVGLLLGLNALNKPTILGFVPCFLLWLMIAIWPLWRRALLVGGVATVVACAILVPWSIRNYGLFGRIIPVTVQAGWAMYEADNPYTDYALRRVEQGETWLNDPRIHEPLAGLSGLSTTEYDARLRALALQFIRDNPGRFVVYALRRVRVFWGAYAHPAHRAFWYVVGPLFAIGFVLAWRLRSRDWRELTVVTLLILQTMSLVILFASMPRYRVPIEPFVLLFAGYALRLGTGSGWFALRRPLSQTGEPATPVSEGAR
jgi:4-amino-4-deoxy-L-arabinose transferase-like glycosyltransferase